MSFKLTSDFLHHCCCMFYDLFVAFLSDLITKYTMITCHFPSQSLPWLAPINHLHSTTFYLYWSSFCSLNMPRCFSLWNVISLDFHMAVFFLSFTFHFTCQLLRKTSLSLHLNFLSPTCLHLLSSPLPYFIFILLIFIWNYILYWFVSIYTSLLNWFLTRI